MRTLKIINWAAWGVGLVAVIVALIMWLALDDWSAAVPLMLIIAATAVIGLVTRVMIGRKHVTG